MTIDRHNYEEFFLLYVDNELKAEERMAVENFVEQNPELREELEMLQQATLPVDEISFDKKELLFRREEGITIDNYQEYFLLSVDKELNEHQAEEVEKFVLKHPALQDEFTILQKTRLEPEVISFGDKAVLYRKERRVIPVAWMRMSAAAVVVSVVAFSWMFATRNGGAHNSSPVVVIQKPVVNKNSSQPSQVPVTKASSSPLDVKQEAITGKEKLTNKAAANKTTQIEQNLAAAPEQKEIKTTERTKKEDVVATNDVAVVAPQVQNIKPVEEQEIKTVAGSSIVGNNSNQNIASVNKPVPNTQPVIMTQAAYKELADNNDEEQTVYIGSLKINKNKIKSLFKKASGVFGKKDKEATEKSIHVAGFEIRTT